MRPQIHRHCTPRAVGRYLRFMSHSQFHDHRSPLPYITVDFSDDGLWLIRSSSLPYFTSQITAALASSNLLYIHSLVKMCQFSEYSLNIEFFQLTIGKILIPIQVNSIDLLINYVFIY